VRDKLIEAGADEVWSKPMPSASDGTLQAQLARLLPQFVLSGET